MSEPSVETLQSIFNVLMEIRKERLRQEELKAAGRFANTCADPGVANRLEILGEEFGEVCRALCEGDRVNLRVELIQVAAVSLAWVQGLDAEDAK